MRIVALIPAFNDAYTLKFCLESVGPHFDEIIVLDDASTDNTPDVATAAAKRWPVKYVRHEGVQLGWVEARNRLATLTDADHLFWLDADDVLCEYNAHLLREIAAGPKPLVWLQLTEMWGDLQHTTQRLKHYDRCHLYTDRKRLGGVDWGGVAMARPLPGRKHELGKSGGPLLFHIKGVKPDWRLVQRQFIRPYMRAPDRPSALVDFIGRMNPEEIHRRAVDMLLYSRQDKLQGTYLPSDEPGRGPRRPGAVLRALPGRFQIVYDPATGRAVDRLDHVKGT